MNIGIIFLTIVGLLFIIGVGSITVSIMTEFQSTQYIPTQPTRPPKKSFLELDIDIGDDSDLIINE